MANRPTIPNKGAGGPNLITAFEFIERALQLIQEGFDSVAASLTSLGTTLGLIKARRSGADTLTWPGGGNVSNALVVPHTLGAVPTTVLATANGQTGTGAVIVFTTAKTSTNITVVGATASFAPLATATTPFSWEVIA